MQKRVSPSVSSRLRPHGLRVLAGAGAAVLLLGACGQKGPLTMPAPTAKAPAPAASAGTR